MSIAPPPTRRGFSLIEVLVAVTIFGIVTVVIFSVFSTALKARDIGQREVSLLQQGRFALDVFETDATNIFFRDETSYNVGIAKMIEDMEQDRMAAEAQNNWDPFYQKWGYPDDHRDKDASKPSIGNPYEQGRVIDLQIAGTDGGKLDTITFAVLDPNAIGKPYRPWGLSRVEYRVDKGWLMRKAATVETEQRNQYGEPLGKNDAPLVSRVAEGVVEFDLRYGFWFDATWYEVDKWDSARRQIRNARFLMGEPDETRDFTRDFEEAKSEGRSIELQPGDPGWNDYINDLDTEPLDRLPAYIRVRIVITDPKNKGRRQVTERLIRIGMAEETFVPDASMGMPERESELLMRDKAYLRVQPAPLDAF